MKKKSAFTLSEVLITLGIIGVVAALTIPNVVKNYQKHATVNRLKTAYTLLSQTVEMSKRDNGDIDEWEIPDFQYSLDMEIYFPFIHKYISPYLKYNQLCSKSIYQCFGIYYKFLDGNFDNFTNSYSVGLKLSNGMLIGISPKNSYVAVMVDINGEKGPNILGKDMFVLAIKKAGNLTNFPVNQAGLVFFGQGYSRDILKNGSSVSGCNKVNQAGGTYCGALIMFDGWKIEDDYPW